MNIKYFGCLILLAFLSCNSNRGNSQKQSLSNQNDLKNLYRESNWNYPIEFCDTCLENERKEVIKTDFALNIRRELLKWGDKILLTDTFSESLRVTNAILYLNKKKDSSVMCRVFLYAKKYKEEKSEVALDNYMVTNDRFLYTKINPVFKYKNGELLFIGYPDYLDMDMLPGNK